MKIKTGKEIVAEKSQEAEEARERARVIRFHQAKITQTLGFLNRVLARFDEDRDGLTLYTWADVNPWSTTTPVKLSTSIYATVSSMKIGIVPSLIKVLLDAGFEIEKTTDYVTEWRGSRNFIFERKDAQHVLHRVEFNAVVNDKDEQATCRKIQVGVEIKEVPKYALDCGDTTPADLAATTV